MRRICEFRWFLIHKILFSLICLLIVCSGHSCCYVVRKCWHLWPAVGKLDVYGLDVFHACQCKWPNADRSFCLINKLNWMIASACWISVRFSARVKLRWHHPGPTSQYAILLLICVTRPAQRLVVYDVLSVYVGDSVRRLPVVWPVIRMYWSQFLCH